jgi:dihydroneopterin aldolase
MAKIIIENMSFYSFHGCFAEEAAIGTNFIVNLEFEYESGIAERSDSIDDAVNYQNVYQVVNKQMNIPSHLIENVARRIKEAVCEEFNVFSCKVKVSKLNPPLGGQIGVVAVEL